MENCVADLWKTREGEDAFVLGTGTSLAGFQWSMLNGRFTVALNDAVKVPGFIAAYHIFSDIGIWKRYRTLTLPKETAVVCQRKARDQFMRFDQCKFKGQVFHFNHIGKVDTIKEKDDSLFVSRTVATGGIMLAWKLGAKRIFLLGVDGFKRSDAYYHNGTTKLKEKRKETQAKDGMITQDRHEWWIKNMNELKAYFRKLKIFMGPYPEPGVYNLSERSNIDAWEKVPVLDVLGEGCFK